MNETKRTAGKWKIDDGQIVTVDDEWSIGYVHGADDFPCIDPDDHDMVAIIEECKQNGRLIAAAPKLLEALEGLLEDWHDGTIPLVYQGKPGMFDVAYRRIAKAKAILRKVKGG